MLWDKLSFNKLPCVSIVYFDYTSFDWLIENYMWMLFFLAAGVDDAESECGLDLYSSWNHIIHNNTDIDSLMEELHPLIKDIETLLLSKPSWLQLHVMYLKIKDLHPLNQNVNFFIKKNVTPKCDFSLYLNQSLLAVSFWIELNIFLLW